MGKVVGLAVDRASAAVGDHALVDTCSRAQSVRSLYPNVSYCPISGLEALSIGSGNHKQNPRVPHCCNHIATAFSYAAIVKKAMDHSKNLGNDNRRSTNSQRYGGSSSGQGMGQGSLHGCGGFSPSNLGFHLGFAGSGPYTGRGGGRYEGRDRPRG
jgi:hypothetical protein